MPFGIFGKDSDEEKEKKQQEEKKKAALEEKRRRQARRRQQQGKKEDEDITDSDPEEEAKKPGRRPGRRPGAKKDDADEEAEAAAAALAAKRRRQKARREKLGKKEDEDMTDSDPEEEVAKKQGRRPGRRPGAKKDDAADAEAEKKAEAEAAAAALAAKRRRQKARREKLGKKEDEDMTDSDSQEEAKKPGRRPGAARPGRPGKAEEEAEKPGRHGKAEAEKPAGRPGHGKPEAEKPAGRPGHGKPEAEAEKPGRPHGNKPHAGGAAGAAGGHAPSHTTPTPMEVDHNNENKHGKHGQAAQQPQQPQQPQHDQNAEQAKIEAQRKKDEAERIRLEKIAQNQPQQPQQPQQPHQGGGGGHAAPGGTVTVKCGESIQDALDAATPGTTILIEAGTYHESLKSRVDGTKQQPITLKGPSSGPTAIIKGSDKSGTCVEINHDYYILDDFTIDGQIKDDVTKDNVKECFREKCLAIRGTRNHRALTKDNGDHYVSAVDGVIVKNMKIMHCGGEGIRLRYFVTNCVLFHNRITSTGCFDFKFGTDQGIKNGEGIYIGTSSKQWSKNLTGEQDLCRFNRVYENYIDTHGNECVDVKEGAMDTIIETNYCTGQMDDDSAGIDSRASGTIIRYNKVVGCKGAGVRLGGHKVGNDQYGTACKVYCNILENNEYGGIKVMVEGNQICQNTIKGHGDKYKAFRGEAAKHHEEGTECPFEVKPPTQDIETTKWFQNCKP